MAARVKWIELDPEILNLITGVIPHFDKIQVWVDRKLTREEKETLYNLNRRKVKGEWIDPKINIYNPPTPYNSSMVQRIQIPQPTPAALSYLNAITEGTAYVNGVEIALDYLTDSVPHANRIKEYFDRTSIKQYHGKQEVGRYEDKTTYSAGERVKNENSSYVRISKITGDPCLHTESIRRSRTTVKAAKIYTLDDVINFDFYGFWNKHLQLRVPDYQQLGKVWIYDLRATRPDRLKPVVRTVRSQSNGSVVCQINLWRRTGYWVAFMCKEMMKDKEQGQEQGQEQEQGQGQVKDMASEKDDDTFYEKPINVQQLIDNYWKLLNEYRSKKGMKECKKNTNKLDRCILRVDTSELLAKCL